MAQFGDSKREYRGSHVRDDAALSEWLGRRPTEAALEPDLPIIDPHHHFWDAPHRGLYLLPGLLSDIGGGHNIISTVFLECRAMYRKDGPRHMAALGEVEFVAGLAAMSASGNVDVTDGNLSGRINAEIGSKGVVVARGGLSPSGTLRDPVLRP